MSKKCGIGEYIDKEMSKRDRKIRQLRFAVAVLFGVIYALLSGCASFDTQMHNPGTGQDYKCEAFGWGWAGTPAAIILHHRCVTTMRERGYVEVRNAD